MASCVRNICTENNQNQIIGFQVTVKNVRDGFFGHSVYIYVMSSVNLNLNKKFELMLTGRAKACSSSCSQTVSLSPAISYISCTEKLCLHLF